MSPLLSRATIHTAEIIAASIPYVRNTHACENCRSKHSLRAVPAFSEAVGQVRVRDFSNSSPTTSAMKYLPRKIKTVETIWSVPTLRQLRIRRRQASAAALQKELPMMAVWM